MFDYIIVGAGSAGCVLANRLSESGADSVLLIEAGGRDDSWLFRMPLGFMMTAANPAYDWGYASEPDVKLAGRSLPVPRGRVHGGSSSINGMIYMRGHSRDYDGWRQMGVAGWSYADVLPYFRRMESSWRGAGPYHGADGPLAVTPVRGDHLLTEPIRQAVRAAGFPESDDLSGAQQEGFSRCEVTVDARGRRASTAAAYLRPALKRSNLTVLSNAQVTRVLIEAGRAVGVEYLRNGLRQEVRAGKEVVLSGGAYNSPQLLMLSGIGPAGQLIAHGIEVVADLPGVGRDLSEHPLVYMSFAARGTSFLEALRSDRAALSVLRWALTGKGAFASQITSGVLMLRTRPELERPDIQLVFLPVRLDAKLWHPFGRRQSHVLSVMVMQLHPESRGSVKLRSADPLARPRIDLNLLDTPGDFADIRGGIAAVRRIFAQPPLRDMVEAEIAPGADADLDAFIRNNLKITQHPTGTCRMGEDPAAVVDSDLRVRGIRGLRVVDASVMPTVPGANINAAVIMVAERASDLIRGIPVLPAEG
ncbi:GMC family oxidoreductase N-terminal domain-containing protein [Sphingomonas psychrotolerans]|uniref:GMC family oxidoreductase N-terminal domain-containing protein n=1 Tax=Sphingomonas psychrotolerans TaxID=1327635 RepID=A0ABU3N715_9SPHN|nr:GMC family oxidoreductase N-terminal domain-containing protein [Sphingomonas psychrotolerans]MDT8760178.1 GMC family oxidoreductase N-terminal domain-containing protein [Sphingomonas psychrotolerans]